MKPDSWYCDMCGEVIRSEDDGYVIWKRDDQGCDYDFKLIHQGRCDRKDYPQSLALRDFTETEGLSLLLSFLSIGPIKRISGDESQVCVADMDEFVDLFRRLHVPHYEEARRLFHDPDLLSMYADNNEVAPYFSKSLKYMVEEFGD